VRVKIMRVVYYGHELYHAASGAQRDNHQYIARIPVGDRFRYFYNQAELAAYNAGKAAKGAVDAAKNTVDKFLHPTFEAGEDRYYDTNHPKNNQGIARTTGKNNTPKNNQGIARIKDSGNAPKNNQGIARIKDSGNAPKNNQGIARIKDSGNAPKNNQGIARIKDSGNAPKNNQGYVGTKSNAPKNNQGIAGQKLKDSGNAPKNNQGYIGQKSPKVSGKPLTGNSEDLYRYYGKKYDSKKINNGTFSAGSGRLDNGTVDRFHVNTDQFKKHKTGSKLKAIEDSFYESYVNDGHDPEKARRWAKNAADNYMKKHK
jgi:hypothetical protein